VTRLYAQHRNRVALVNGLFGIALLIVLGKLFAIQLIHHDEYRLQAVSQSTEIAPIPAERGHILARNGESLTTNIINYSIAVDPQVLTEKDSLAVIFERTFNRPAADYLSLMNKDRSFVWLERNVPKNQAQPILNLQHQGLLIERQVRRRYPYNELAAPLVGFTDVDGLGISGIELEFDQQLKGVDGEKPLKRNAKNQVLPLPKGTWTLPVNGQNVILTINLDYQSIVQEELLNAQKRLSAVLLHAVLMDPNSGDVLAIAQYPNFDPNNPAASPAENRRLLALTDMYEPGSTLKVVPVAAVLEEGLYSPTDLFDCEGGEFVYRNLVIRDTHPAGIQSLADIIVYSSNIGIIKIAEELGSALLYKYSTRFGLGARTGAGLQGESPGLLREPSRWSSVSTGEIAMGQEVGVTTLQLAQLYSAIANGGLLLRPRLVLGTSTDIALPPEDKKPEIIRRVASSHTMAELREILYHTVEQGTGLNARLAGYKIAGKTGTAQKFVGDKYSEKEFMPTFAAMIPAEKPKLVCVIAIDSPVYGLHFGSEAAAPVVRKIFQRILHLENDFYAPPRQEQLLATAIASSVSVLTNTAQESLVRPGIMPNMQGASLRSAINMAHTAGVNIQVQGSGRVINQSIEAGRKVDESALCIVTLEGES